MNLTNQARLEALLFYRGEEVSTAEIAAALDLTQEEVVACAQALAEELGSRGIRLIRGADTMALASAPEMGELIENLRKEALSGELSKAAAETLAIILYRGPLTRTEIDYIRGVNSTFILRNLQIRGLIEKIPNPDDQRAFMYKPTLDLLAHLGITRIEELPEFDKVKRELESFATSESVGSESIQDQSSTITSHAHGAGESDRQQ